MVEWEVGGVGRVIVAARPEQHVDAMRRLVVDVVLDEPQPGTHLEQVEHRDAFLVGARPCRHRGRRSRIDRRRRFTSTPTAAWTMLFAVLHEISRVLASTGPPGPNGVSGDVP